MLRTRVLKRVRLAESGMSFPPQLHALKHHVGVAQPVSVRFRKVPNDLMRRHRPLDRSGDCGDIGLLRPVEVDRQSGYRYYAVEQLPRLHRILALKELGFSLEEIAYLIDAVLTNEQMREMLRSRQSELERRVREEQQRQKRPASHSQMLSKMDGMV